jgi:hypothetical protein
MPTLLLGSLHAQHSAPDFRFRDPLGKAQGEPKVKNIVSQSQILGTLQLGHRRALAAYGNGPRLFLDNWQRFAV